MGSFLDDGEVPGSVPVKIEEACDLDLKYDYDLIEYAELMLAELEAY